MATRQRHRSAAAQEIAGLDAVAALRHARWVARLSQRDLARRAGVSQSLVARIEARRVDPPVGQMQRLLGLCGMRWEFQLVAGGATPAVARARNVMVQKRARARDDAAAARRMHENAAARDTAVSAAVAFMTVRERRQRCRAARLAERAIQAALFAELVSTDDTEARRWTIDDAAASIKRLKSVVQRHEMPLVERLAAAVGDDAHSIALLHVLATLAPWAASPPVALTGAIARVVWSPSYRLRTDPVVELAALRGPREAQEFMARAGAVSIGRRMFLLGKLRIRLLPTAPQSTSLVQCNRGRPARAVPVARPESRPGAGCDRHSVRAALASAGRDGRGRRRPPYHETWDGAVRPWWVEPGWPVEPGQWSRRAMGALSDDIGASAFPEIGT